MAVALTPGQPPAAGEDRPRAILAPVALGDKIFRGVLRSASLAVLVITALILVFLIFRSVSALQAVGFRFFTTSTWFIGTNQFGIAAILPLGILAALFALFIAVPVGIATALFISEYAPPKLRRAFIALIDLMAAVPSIIVALFAVFFVMPRILGFESWLGHHLGFIPLFQFRLANYPSNYANATFIAGVAVSLLVIPIVVLLLFALARRLGGGTPGELTRRQRRRLARQGARGMKNALSTNGSVAPRPRGRTPNGPCSLLVSRRRDSARPGDTPGRAQWTPRAELRASGTTKRAAGLHASGATSREGDRDPVRPGTFVSQRSFRSAHA